MEIVNIAFSLINSAIILSLCVYAFRVWILPSVYQELSNTLAKRTEKSERQIALSNNILELDKERGLKDDVYRSLMDKVTIWSRFHEERARLYSEERTQHTKLYNMRLDQQYAHVVLKTIEKKVLPGALRQAEMECKSYFASEKIGADFVTAAIDSLSGDIHV